MADHRRELKSRYRALSRLYADLSSTAFARRDWHDEVLDRQTLGSDERIEHWFLAEHFLANWSNWSGLLDRFSRYFGQCLDSFPKSWSKFTLNCDALVFQLARDEGLDRILAESWADSEEKSFRPDSRKIFDIAAIYGQLAKACEHAELVSRAESVSPNFTKKGKSANWTMSDRAPFPVARQVVEKQNDEMLGRWHELPEPIQDQVWVHLRHYLHSVLGVSWLFDSSAARSALLSISWRKQPVSLSVEQPLGTLPPDVPAGATVDQLLERVKAAIAELGYEAVVEDLLSRDMVGGEDSLLPSQDVTVVPDHLAQEHRPILLAVTRGWSGKDPLSFTTVMRQVKTRLIEVGKAIEVVIALCDCWDSSSFQEEHRDELAAHARKGVRFLFLLVGVPDRVLGQIPVELQPQR